MMFSGRGRRSVSGHPVHEHMGSKLAEILEYYGPRTCNNAYQNEKKAPFSRPGEINGTNALFYQYGQLLDTIYIGHYSFFPPIRPK